MTKLSGQWPPLSFVVGGDRAFSDVFSPVHLNSTRADLIRPQCRLARDDGEVGSRGSRSARADARKAAAVPPRRVALVEGWRALYVLCE
jgi:hypothetical protein